MRSVGAILFGVAVVAAVVAACAMTPHVSEERVQECDQKVTLYYPGSRYGFGREWRVEGKANDYSNGVLGFTDAQNGRPVYVSGTYVVEESCD